jgi:hypothetical protein
LAGFLAQSGKSFAQLNDTNRLDQMRDEAGGSRAFNTACYFFQPRAQLRFLRKQGLHGWRLSRHEGVTRLTKRDFVIYLEIKLRAAFNEAACVKLAEESYNDLVL